MELMGQGIQSDPHNKYLPYHLTKKNIFNVKLLDTLNLFFPIIQSRAEPRLIIPKHENQAKSSLF